jgi:hypothetical protein
MAADKERGAGGSASAEIGKYLEILAKEPNSRVFAPLAEAYRKAGLLEDAIETAREGLQVHPNYLGGRVALGRAYFEKRMYGEAREEMQRVVKAAPDNLMAHKILGQISWEQGDAPAAEKAFRMVLVLDPRDNEARQALDKIAAGAPTVPPVQAAPPPAPAVAVPGQPVQLPETLVIQGREPLVLETPRAAQPARPAPAPPAAPAGIESIDLPGIEALEEPIFPAPEPAPALPSLPEPAPEPPPLREPELEEPEVVWDIPVPPPSPVPAPGASPSAAAAPAPPPAAAPAPEAAPEPDEAPGEEPMSLEVFAREPWGSTAGGSTSRGAGRPEREEREAYEEIELEPTAHVAAPAEAEFGEVPEGGIEVFTRESVKAGATPRGRSREGEGFREIDLAPAEPADAPAAEEPAPAAAPAPPAFAEPEEPMAMAPGPGAEEDLGPEQEIPSIDLAGELEFGTVSGQEVEHEAPAPPPPAEAEADPFAEISFEEVPFEDVPDVEPQALAPAAEPEPEPAVVSLDEEIPKIDLASELEPEPAAVSGSGFAATQVAELGTEHGEPEFAESGTGFVEAESEEEEVPEEPAGPAAGRGVFDTETLAAIYVSQGFHGRAVEIYQRLLAERPGDGGLQRKLDEVRALAGGPQAASPPAVELDLEPAPAVPEVEDGFEPAPPEPAPQAAPASTAPAPPAGAADNETIRRLRILLEAFQGGRPQ